MYGGWAAAMAQAAAASGVDIETLLADAEPVVEPDPVPPVLGPGEYVCLRVEIDNYGNGKEETKQCNGVMRKTQLIFLHGSFGDVGTYQEFCCDRCKRVCAEPLPR